MRGVVRQPPFPLLLQTVWWWGGEGESRDTQTPRGPSPPLAFVWTLRKGSLANTAPRSQHCNPGGGEGKSLPTGQGVLWDV